MDGKMLSKLRSRSKIARKSIPIRTKKPISRKSKFKDQSNVFKTYHQKRSQEEVRAYAEQCVRERLENPTEAEASFAEVLRGQAIRFEREKIFFYANGTKFIIVDFILIGYNIAVEIDGCQHKRRQSGYDRGRDQWLAAQGIRTVRFTNKQVLSEAPTVRQMLMEIIDGTD